ncbi:MAG: hypothetical protein ACXQS8_04345 [Candidatus Helarchaeales archaeon]
MTDGVILSAFDEVKGFIPIEHVPSGINSELIQEIILRVTIFTMGGVRDLIFEREALFDYPEEGILGTTFTCTVDSPDVRGGKKPLILISFTADSNRANLYQKLIEMMKNSKRVMYKIKKEWNQAKFTNKKRIRSWLKEHYEFMKREIAESPLKGENGYEKSVRFIVKCPACSNEVVIGVPKNIKDLLAIPITNLPCGHKFEAYFTKGPELRGTSQVQGSKENEIRDIFDKI